MKRHILVLDAFTNGHEAAPKFIRKMGWTRRECKIIFCGSHGLLLTKLTQGPAYAVVPVHNSIAGEVTEVTRRLETLRQVGYDFKVVCEIDSQINHCLLAPPHVTSATQLTRVMSHEKAIQQCGVFLDRIGITPDRQSRKDSTGNAAKIVSKFPVGVMIGAIASKGAARAYGLNILAEGIQDTKRNITTFQLLENQAEVKSVTVGIIGINGRFGKVLKTFFEQLGCAVIGSDKKGEVSLSNVQVVKRADVVIFSIPIRQTPGVIKSLMRYTREDQLLMDVTSVKQPAIKAMLKGKAQVVGLHPMFAPKVPFEGQTIVVCPVRVGLPHWKTWVVNMLAATGTKIKWSSPDEHDAYMATVQASPQSANLINALLITEMGVSTAESLSFTSPFYHLMFATMGRLLHQDPNLYAEIFIENPMILPMIKRRIKIERRIFQLIRRKDEAGLVQLFKMARDHFGSNVVKEADALFLRLIAVTKTLYGQNTSILEFTKASNRPGLLEKIVRVFRRRGINLTGISYVQLDENHHQFTISFDQLRRSAAVHHALEEIENWQEPHVKVIA